MCGQWSGQGREPQAWGTLLKDPLPPPVKAKRKNSLLACISLLTTGLAASAHRTVVGALTGDGVVPLSESGWFFTCFEASLFSPPGVLGKWGSEDHSCYEGPADGVEGSPPSKSNLSQL